MNPSRMVELVVGLFVAAGLGALFILAMKVSNFSVSGASAGYEIVAKFDNIGGLKVRSQVAISGVRIGQVSNIRFDQTNYEAIVTMVIESQYNKLPTDSTASILTSGLLGEQYIGLEPGAEETYMKAGAELPLTQSAIVLEKLISQFLFSKAEEGATKKDGGSTGAATEEPPALIVE